MSQFWATLSPPSFFALLTLACLHAWTEAAADCVHGRQEQPEQIVPQDASRTACLIFVWPAGASS